MASRAGEPRRIRRALLQNPEFDPGQVILGQIADRLEQTGPFGVVEILGGDRFWLTREPEGDCAREIVGDCAGFDDFKYRITLRVHPTD